MHSIPEPNLRDLLLPLLSCLPIAFVSSRPPPGLLPLLSPILRQRVHLRSVNTVASPHDASSSSANWLSLLTWSPAHARRLTEICSTLLLEAHPVSGELELFSDEADEIAGKARYKRLDVETLQARSDIREHSLRVIWVWCENDDGAVGLPGTEGLAGSAQDGWKVADIQPLDEQDTSRRSQPDWAPTLGEAEESYASSGPTAQQTHESLNNTNGNSRTMTPGANSTATNDDDYWAGYDRTPNQSPAVRQPHPVASTTTTGNAYDPSRERQPSIADDYWARYDHTPEPTPSQGGAMPRGEAAATTTRSHDYSPRPAQNGSTKEEAEYFARYGSVQPALDADDPDEKEAASAFASTLRQGDRGRSDQYRSSGSNVQNTVQGDNEPPITVPATGASLRIHSPTPSRPSTSSSGRSASVEKLEASASALDGSRDQAPSAAEVGVKQHISTELKSLFRLARAAGVERSEFERVIKMELDVLDMMDV